MARDEGMLRDGGLGTDGASLAGWESRAREMPMDIPASNSCLRNSKSLLSSAADPKRLPSLLTPLASSAGAGGSGSALVIMAHLWDEAVKRESEEERHPDSEQPPGRGRRSCPARSHQQRRMRPAWVSAIPSMPLAPSGNSWQQEVGLQEVPQLLVLSCQAGTGSEGSPGSTTRTAGSSTGRDEAGGVARGQWGDMDGL